MMNNESYWRKRKAQQMFEYMESAEKTARTLEESYQKASRYLQEEAEKVFEKFRTDHDISEKEAELLLKNKKTPETIEELKALLREDKKNKELLKELESQAYKARMDRLSNLYAQLDAIVLPMMAEERRRTALFYKQLAEEAYYKSIFDLQQYAGYNFGIKVLDEKNIRKILDTKWSGKSFSQSIWDNTEALAEALKKELLVNLMTGSPLKRAQDEIDKKFHSGYNNARRLVRTESTYITNQMQKQSYEACGVERYIFVAVLDLRTSLTCRKLDKKDFLVEEAQPGINYPPMHPWCRSTTIGWMPAELLKKLKQSARNPKTGEHMLVPGDMTYKEWYEKYMKEEVAFSSDKKQEGNSEVSKEEQKRLLAITKTAHEVAEKYVSRDSKWSGNVNAKPKAGQASGGKEWNCDISLVEGATKHIALHEELHGRSISYYDPKTYINNKPMEELAVELLSREICRAEGWDITYSKAYKEIKYLTYINRKAKIAKNSLEFAKKLFDVPVTQRAAWLDNKILDASPGFVEYNKTKKALERILAWKG